MSVDYRPGPDTVALAMLNEKLGKDADCYITVAPYAKGQLVVKCKPNGSGFKTRAARLCEALRGRWVHRSNGYVMSLAKTRRFAALYPAGWDGTFITNELVPPKATP